jgi:hypothetical protein
MAQRILNEIPPAQQQPTVMREPRAAPAPVSQPRHQPEFTALNSTGELTMITDTTGRSAPADLVAAAKRYIEASGSELPPFELALAAANDHQLRRKLLAY